MNRVMMLVMLFLMCFQGAWAQLPPDIQADRHLMSAMKFIESKDYDSAKKEFESIIKLNIKVPNDFYFHYGKTLIKNFDLESGKKMIEKFIALTGRSSEMYKPALELLAEAEDLPFKADGKEWLVGKQGINWNETQSWINSLGGGWRAPTRAELKSLYNAVGRDSPICSEAVWAEKKDSSYGWRIMFGDGGNEAQGKIDGNYGWTTPVAVRQR